MKTHVKPLVAALCLAGLPSLATAGVVSYPTNPGFNEPSYSQAQYDAHYQEGRALGRKESAAECIGKPATCGCNDGLSDCGITVTDVLTGAEFGETEPNDHIIAADPLITDHVYWGQSRDLLDEDWFYVTTVEPNQLLTLAFTVPDRVLADNTRLSQGWLVSVTDAAGNVYSQFDTRFALDDPATTNKNESKEISYPTFLGRTGTYYVQVKPQISAEDQADPNTFAILYWPYNLAGNLSFSGLDNAPPDVNFHDVEVENNDTQGAANRLTSGVTMYGFLHQNAADAASGEIAGDEDWFRYSSTGNEQINLNWCGREACAEDAIWTVEVYTPNGTQLLSTTTDKAENLHFGIGAAGDYYVRVRYQVSTTAQCVRRSDAEVVCKSDEVPRCFMDTANQYSLNTCATASVANLYTDTGAGGETGNCDTAGYGSPCYAGPEQAIAWTMQGTDTFCNQSTLSPATGCNQDGVFPSLTFGTGEPDGGESIDPRVGAARYRKFQFQVVCAAGVEFECLEYASTVDPNALNVQYNFTWWGTKLVPLTSH